MEVFPLDWDSAFFQSRIAKAIVASEDDVTELSEQAGKLREQYDLIYIFSDPGLEMHLEQAVLVDKKAIFTLSDPGCFETDPHIACWGTSQGAGSLIPLALVSGKYSRFKLDPRLPFGSYERLYTRWIEQSVSRSIATEVFCYMVEGQPRGLLTLDRKDDRNVIGLVAVDEDYQHRGIGRALVMHAVSYVHKYQGKSLSVTTQLDNVPACRLYSGSGFSLESVTKIWHWWL